jgi:hypothetical protein
MKQAEQGLTVKRKAGCRLRRGASARGEHNEEIAVIHRSPSYREWHPKQRRTAWRPQSLSRSTCNEISR